MSLSSARPITVYRDRRYGRRRAVFIVLGLLIGLLALVAAWALTSVNLPRTSGAVAQLVEIPSGSSTDQIAQLLVDQKIVVSKTAFTLAVVLSGSRGKLQAGTYELSAGMSPRDIVGLLSDGKTKEHRVTIPEGLRIDEVARLVADAGVTSSDEFIAAASESYDVEAVRDLPTGASLEGFLFPDTYTFPEGATARDVVSEMLQTFETTFASLQPDLESTGLELLEFVTLASIVEAEVPLAADRPKVASVFFNRLEADMRLQADSTVAFALKLRELALTDEQLATESPYNTYLRKGLPPGPINSPSLESMRAVLEPADTDFLYFVSNPDTNETFFATTLEEHNANIERTRQED